MKTVTVSANLADILRDRIDEVTDFKRRTEIDKRVLADYSAGKPLTKEQNETVQDYLYARFLHLFLDAREELVIPDDAVHRLASEFHTSLGELAATFRYEEFYAYQFADKLDDIVRRARKIRHIYTTGKVFPNVTALCREAYQAYLNGHHTASVALVRCLVESTLKSRLRVEFGELGKLNDIALEKAVYQKTIWHKVDQIRRQANAIVHEAANERSASEADNLRLIGLAQEVLQAIHI